MLVRRGNLRRAAYAGLVLLAVVVYLDRVLLGRHFPSDVAGGALLGVGVVLVGLAAYSPLPVQPRDPRRAAHLAASPATATSR